MYGVIALFAVILAMILPPSVRADRAPFKTRPRVVENGSDVVTLPFPADTPGGTATNIAFGPDGTAYFVDAPNELASVSPAGVYTKIPVPRASAPQILFARGNLWMSAGSSGVVEVAPNGSHSRWYAFNNANGGFYATGIAMGPKNAVYVGGFNNSPTLGLVGTFESIDTHGVATAIPTPVVPSRFAFNKAGQLYFGYSNGAEGFARLETDGSTTLLPWPYPRYTFDNGLQSFVSSVDGNIYFSTYVYPPTGDYVGFFGRISPSGVITQIPLPLQDNSYLDDISTDFGGNVWLAYQTTSQFHELYQYDIYNGKFTGPYEPTLIDQVYAGPFVGPDDNIWTVRFDTDIHHYYEPMAFQVFVRKIQTLEPASISVAAGIPTPFTILETHFNGPWTAVSLNPSVATVSPASSASGQFTVSETGPGSTSIMVKDNLGNFSYETVSTH
jgi:hypothetical protein